MPIPPPRYKIFDLVAAKTLFIDPNDPLSYVIGWISYVHYDDENGWVYRLEWSDGLTGTGMYLEEVVFNLVENYVYYSSIVLNS